MNSSSTHWVTSSRTAFTVYLNVNRLQDRHTVATLGSCPLVDSGVTGSTLGSGNAAQVCVGSGLGPQGEPHVVSGSKQTTCRQGARAVLFQADLPGARPQMTLGRHEGCEPSVRWPDLGGSESALSSSLEDKVPPWPLLQLAELPVRFSARLALTAVRVDGPWLSRGRPACPFPSTDPHGESPRGRAASASRSCCHSHTWTLGK